MSEGRIHSSRHHELISTRRRRRQPVGRILLRSGLRLEGTVVDIGAGAGYFTIPMARRCRVVAMDSQREMLEALSSRVSDEDVRVVRANADAIPLADSSVDGAVMVNVLHEVDDIASVGREVTRILRPGGELLVVDVSPNPMNPIGPPQHVRLPMDDAIAAFPDLCPRLSWDDGNFYHVVLSRRRPQSTRLAGSTTTDANSE